MFKSHRAFSLIELMLVITIISILTVIAISTYRSSQMRSRDVQRKTVVMNIASSLEQYRSANSAYAPQYNNYNGSGFCDSNLSSSADHSGLGNCFWNSNYNGLSATCNSVNNRDPLFLVEDPGTGATVTNQCTSLFAGSAVPYPYSGYLLNFMAKPTMPGTTVPTGTGSFPNSQHTVIWDISSTSQPDPGHPGFNRDAINYLVQGRYYMIRVVLETKGAAVVYNPGGSCAPGGMGGTANANGNWDIPTLTNPQWRNATYSIGTSGGANCGDNNYRIFQKSSLSSL